MILAGQVDWSMRDTCTSDAPRMTWKLVTMWPFSSQTNPLPWPVCRSGVGWGGMWVWVGGWVGG
jgi:hypothetical protein